jgi:hypothetical protein
MKKISILLSLVLALIVLGWLALDLTRKDGVSDSEFIEFAVKDTNSVSKIIISDAFSNTFTLVRNGDEWTDKNGGCMSQMAKRQRNCRRVRWQSQRYCVGQL